MNRRVRTHCRSSSSSSSSSSPKREEGGFYKFLRPGALAQLRDSRISARSHQRQISLHIASSSSSSTSTDDDDDRRTTQIEMIEDGFPCFSGRIFSPRYPQRKKLLASKSMFFLSSNPSSPDSSDSLLMDVLSNNTDLLVSH